MKTLHGTGHEQHRALLDPLTGLPQRALLHDRLTVALARAGRAKCYVGMLSITIEFETLRSNQAKARAIGEIAIRLTSLLRPDDTAARIENSSAFVVICNVVADEQDADAISTRLAAGVRAPLAFDMEPIAVTVRVSFVLAPPDDDAGRLLDEAARVALTP